MVPVNLLRLRDDLLRPTDPGDLLGGIRLRLTMRDHNRDVGLHLRLEVLRNPPQLRQILSGQERRKTDVSGRRQQATELLSEKRSELVDRDHRLRSLSALAERSDRPDQVLKNQVADDRGGARV